MILSWSGLKEKASRPQSAGVAEDGVQLAPKRRSAARTSAPDGRKLALAARRGKPYSVPPFSSAVTSALNARANGRLGGA